MSQTNCGSMIKAVHNSLFIPQVERRHCKTPMNYDTSSIDGILWRHTCSWIMIPCMAPYGSPTKRYFQWERSRIKMAVSWELPIGKGKHAKNRNIDPDMLVEFDPGTIQLSPQRPGPSSSLYDHLHLIKNIQQKFFQGNRKISVLSIV